MEGFSANRIGALAKKLGGLLQRQDLAFDERQKLSLRNLEYYIGNTLLKVVNSGRDIREEDAKLVGRLEKAMEIIEQDKKVEQKEIDNLIKISDDLEISDSELEQLKKS